MPCDNCRCRNEACSWPTGGRGKAFRTCKRRRVSCQVDGELVVGGKPRSKKNDRSPACKKRKVSHEIIAESGSEAKEEVVQPEARPPSVEGDRVCEGPVRGHGGVQGDLGPLVHHQRPSGHLKVPGGDGQ